MFSLFSPWLYKSPNKFYSFTVQIPSLEDFDTFKVRACGFYCPQDCHRGFPTVLLREHTQCLNNSRVLGNYSNEQVKEAEKQLQVSKIKVKLKDAIKSLWQDSLFCHYFLDVN